uniref:Col_cuticle_N domain-containing protein n=1 Tax=Heterorhabditis bacteriophora TaxID=37862 RepID=A0A1I7WIT7_HETBA
MGDDYEQLGPSSCVIPPPPPAYVEPIVLPTADNRGDNIERKKRRKKDDDTETENSWYKRSLNENGRDRIGKKCRSCVVFAIAFIIFLLVIVAASGTVVILHLTKVVDWFPILNKALNIEE